MALRDATRIVYEDKDDEDFNPWTAEGAERFRAAASELADNVLRHAEAIIASRNGRLIEEVFEANDELTPFVLEYADAQFEFTGNGFPFGIVMDYWRDEDDDEDEDEDEAATAITILQRNDYRVLDEERVIAAGRAASDEVGGEVEVNRLGTALYCLAHIGDWSSLRVRGGLEPIGGRAIVVRQDQPLGSEPDEWPDDLFETDGEILFGQDDVFVAGPPE